MKTVDKYQFNQDTPFYQEGIHAYLAIHTVLKKKFIVKMISFGSDREKENNNYLTKQCQILKKIIHENVYKCHKLLKSKNNFYGVFDFIEGKTLRQFLKQEISFENKSTIFKQLIQLLFQFSSRKIVSLNFSPENIMIQENCRIMVKNFGLGQEFDSQQKEKNVQINKFVLGQHTPPEIRQGKVYRNSDCYSFGVLVNVLFASQFKKMDNFKQKTNINLEKYGINSSLSIENIKNLATNLANKQSKDRSDLKDLLIVKKSYLTVTPQKVQKCPSPKASQRNRLQIPQQFQKKVLNISRSSSNISLPQQKGRQKLQSFEKLLQVILKKRGFTILLLKLSEAIMTNKQPDLSLTIELLFLFIKKATITISQLAKLLSKGFNSQYLINQKNFQGFQKEKAFIHFSNLLNKQMKSTQQKFQYMLTQVKKIIESSKNQNLKIQTRSQNINEEYLKKTVLQFLLQLRLINTDDYASEFQKDSLSYIYIMSLLSDFKSFQEIYSYFFSQEVVEMKEQPFYKQISLLSKVKLVELIEKNTTKLYSQTDISFDLSVKTTQTTKTLKTTKSYQ